MRVGGAMGDKFLIRKDIDAYMADLKRWLLEAEEVKLEEMTGFFAARVDQYEEHMAIWKKAYRHMGKLQEKFPQVKTICADCFSCELGEKTFDAAVSFETLHHFKPENVFIHFDTPLTAEHEMELIRCAGFGCVEWGGCIEGAAFLTATAEESK